MKKVIIDAPSLPGVKNAIPPSEVRDLATHMHEKMCHHNHIDYCDFKYGSWNNMSYAHKNYAEKAERVLALVELELAKQVVDAITGY